MSVAPGSEGFASTGATHPHIFPILYPSEVTRKCKHADPLRRDDGHCHPRLGSSNSRNVDVGRRYKFFMIRPFASPAVPHKLWLKNGEDTLRGRSPYLYGVVVCFCSQEGAICSRMAGPLSSFLGLCPGFFYENFKNEVLFDVPFAVDWGTCRRHWSISVGTNTPTVVNVHYLYCVGYLPPPSLFSSP